MKELISVIVPVYRAEKYLNRCIESIVNQTYTCIEVILVDDGSPDNCPIMCDKWARQDKRIRVIHQVNSGLSAARNAGLDIVQGEYIGFIDSDDFINPNFLQVMYDMMIKYKADIVSVDSFDFVYNREIKMFDTSLDRLNVKVFRRDEALKEYFVPKQKRIIHHGVCMKLFRSICFGKLRFKVGSLHEDLYVTYKLLDKASIFVFIPVKFYYYNHGNQGSICTCYKFKNFSDELNATVEMLKYFEDNEILFKYVKCFVIDHYCFLLGKSDIDINKADIAMYQRKCKEMRFFLRQNATQYLFGNEDTITKKFAFCLMMINRRLYVWVKTIRNLLRSRE